MVNPIATITNSLRGPALKPEQPAAAQKKPQAPQAQPVKPATTAPNQATFTPIQITTAPPANPVAIPESAVETIASEFASEVTSSAAETDGLDKRKKKESTSNASKETPISHSSSPSPLKAIYQKIYDYDHSYRRSEPLTLTQKSWWHISHQLNLNALTPKKDGIEGYDYLGLTKKELKKLAEFTSSLPKEGPIIISHDIAKILKHAIRNVKFDLVATPQDLAKRAVSSTAKGISAVMSYIPIINILDKAPTLLVNLVFGGNAFLRELIQTGVKGAASWTADKVVREVHEVEQPIKDVTKAIRRSSSSSSVNEPTKSDI
jgi:hypothetical protein